MSQRGRHRKRSRSSLLAPPVVAIAAAGLAVTAAHAAAGNGHHAPRPAADVQHFGPSFPLPPFAATPRFIPLVVTAPAEARAHRHKTKARAASAPIAKLPTHLDVTASTIPRRVLESYVNATKLADHSDRACHLRWQTLAGIGFIESDHGRSGGSANPHWDGVAFPPILGPVLDGHGGVGKVRDTDGGLLDGNPTWDRAVGPMQFIPSTWARYAADGNHDGVKNPEDIDDATLAAAHYLCATGPDLNKPKHLIRAVYAYNHSYSYVRAVLTVTAHYMNINPAKLGINGLPKGHKHKHLKLTLIVVPAGPPTAKPTPSPSPTHAPAPSPTPTPTPSTSPTPTPSPSTSASPTPSTPTPTETSSRRPPRDP